MFAKNRELRTLVIRRKGRDYLREHKSGEGFSQSRISCDVEDK